VAWRYRTADGDYGSLAAWRGRPLLVHVLATWSAPALLEVPMLRELHDSDQIRVLGVVVDREPGTAQIFAESFELGYPVVRPADLERFMGEAGPFGPISILPTSFLLDAQGRMLARNEGTWQPATLRRLIQKIEGPEAKE
jgi:thiol-disulfide isomerase/thioredoxin